jgi:protein-L-isoaspartate(D-aspartate) O-methyltransferase
MANGKASIDDIREFYARILASVAGAANGHMERVFEARLERAFESVPREAFLGPGPWQIKSGAGGGYVLTPNDDPLFLYQNVLVAIDAERGINNGEPALHAMQIGSVRPQPGETVVHIGAGLGYYSAILALLVLPGGRVQAYEVEPTLAARAKSNLEPFENVRVVTTSAATGALPRCDVIYVNASVQAPSRSWLAALSLGGRLIFPWCACEQLSVAMRSAHPPVTRRALSPRPITFPVKEWQQHHTRNRPREIKCGQRDQFGCVMKRAPMTWPPPFMIRFGFHPGKLANPNETVCDRRS